MSETPTPTRQGNNRPGFFRLFASATAAAFGVQSGKKLERDFSQTSAIPFIFIGVLFTGVFIGLLVFAVSLIV